MRTIEIATPQNVTIKFDLAGSGQRILAFILDAGLIMLYIWIIEAVSGSLTSWPESATFILYIPVFFYTVASEYFFSGLTFGKMVVGIRVIKLDGSAPEFMDYFGRWSSRLVDIYLSGGAIALILVSTTGNAQRIGDILSGTVVVNSRSSSRFTLSDILKLQNSENYEAVYPEIKQLSEKEMVLVKMLVDRYEEHPNQANKNLVRQTANHLIYRLQIQTNTNPDDRFLKALIKDFVILSR